MRALRGSASGGAPPARRQATRRTAVLAAIAATATAALQAGCASASPELGMAVEDFDQACFESDRARGRLVFSESNRQVWYCDLWDTHYVFEDGILVSIQQELPAGAE